MTQSQMVRLNCNAKKNIRMEKICIPRKTSPANFSYKEEIKVNLDRKQRKRNCGFSL
jgi:hypothetical protein